MARLTPALLGTVLTLSSAVRAWSDIEVADTVQADTETPVSVDLDSDAASFRIYLAITPPGWGTGPVCYLVSDADTSVTSVDVTIPASVVPDGTVLSLAYSTFDDTDDYEYGGSGYDYSNDFEFDGGTGEWSELELNGYGISSPDYTPCSALQCSRNCGNKYYPDGSIDMEDDSEFYDTYEDWYNCVSECPGTSYPPYDEIMGDDDEYMTATATWSTDYPFETGFSTASATASATPGSSEAHTTSSAAQATATSSPSSASETASTTSAASSTSTVTTSSASRASLATTAILMWCVGMFLLM